MRRIQFIFILLLIAILVALPQVIKSDSTINLAVYVLLFVSLASSWNILGGFSGQTNLGHAAFFGAGALTTRMLWFSGWHLFPSLLAGGLVAVALALLIGVPAFRLRGVYFAIGTLALSQILYITVGNMLPMISSLPAQDLAVYQLAPRYYLFLAIALVTIAVSYALINSRLGLGILAVREEEDAAESLGVSALKHKLVALALSAFFAGLTGGGFAFYHVGYYPQLTFGPEWTFDAMMMAYIGGVGTIVGPIIGAIFFVILRELLALKLAEMHLIVFGTLFILVVLFLPGGFMGVWGKIRKALAR
ncbi:MAG: branched-chain amino acid ABC transporter permease [Anaerolineales bacterium]|nr:branched-chain amino acid ABC transporter permease [Anaerolineales bacterium]